MERVRQLKDEAGRGIWLCGGADLASTLFAEQLIDQLNLKVNPFLMGSGIPLFSGVIQQTASNSHFESFTVQAELVEARSPCDKLRANGELKAYKAILRTAGKPPLTLTESKVYANGVLLLYYAKC